VTGAPGRPNGRDSWLPCRTRPQWPRGCSSAAAQALAQPGSCGATYIGDLEVVIVVLSLFGTLPLGLVQYPTVAARQITDPERQVRNAHIQDPR
jgi:hypothetical protein